MRQPAAAPDGPPNAAPNGGDAGGLLARLQPTANVFCPTRSGGGVDPSCGKGGEGGQPAQLASPELIAAMKPKELKALADKVGFVYGVRSPKAIRTRLESMHEQGTLVAKSGQSHGTAAPAPVHAPAHGRKTPFPQVSASQISLAPVTASRT